MPYTRPKRMQEQNSILKAMQEMIPKEVQGRDAYLKAMASYRFHEGDTLKEEKNGAFPVVLIGAFAGIEARLTFLPMQKMYRVSFVNKHGKLFSCHARLPERVAEKTQEILSVTGERPSPETVKAAMGTFLFKRQLELDQRLSKTYASQGSDARTKFFRILSYIYRSYPGIPLKQMEKIAAAILVIAYQPKGAELQEAIFMESPAAMPDFQSLMAFRPQNEKDAYFLVGEMSKGKAAGTAIEALRDPKSLLPGWMGYDQIRDISKACARNMERERVQKLQEHRKNQ